MIRGFVAGVAWGCVVAGLGLVVVSQVAQRPLPQAGIETAATPDATVAGTPVVAALPASENPVVAPAPEPAATLQGVAPASNAPDPVVEPVLPAEAIVAPAPPAARPVAEASPATDLPVQSAPVGSEPPSGLVPPEPVPAGDPVRVDAPPPVPEEVLLEPAPAPLADPAPGLVALEAGGAATPQPLPQTPLPAPDLAPDPAPDLPIARPLPLPEPGALPAPAAEEAAEETAEDPVAVPPQTPQETIPAPVLQPVAPIVTAEAPRTLAPDPGLPAVDGVTLGQLPKIKPADAPEPEPGAQPAAADAPPIQQFARAFDNPDGKPLFAVLLRDTGAADLDRAALAGISFPVSFVIDPLLPGAAEAAAIYRAAGQEVLMLATGIPVGATPGDVEQSLQAMAQALPFSVGVIDQSSEGFQDNRALAAQVVQVLGAQGRGVVTFDSGLNAADQEARRAALPSAVIFRRLDAEGEAIPTIRRYLDRAAFKAAQEGRVVVFGDARPDTVAALLEWTVEGRAASVSLAPITAVMRVP